MKQNKNSLIDKIIDISLREDGIRNDITTCALGLDRILAKGVCISKSNFVLAGLPVVKKIFKKVDRQIKVKELKKDGDFVKKGEEIFYAVGKASSLLKCERTVLNFLQNLSGIATESRKISKLSKNIFGTRKTTPGMRLLQKYALVVGGVNPHRYSLSDGILIKDNHIVCSGGVKNAICKVKSAIKNKTIKRLPIEIEISKINDIEEAIREGADIILLDNMDIKTLKKSVRIIREMENKFKKKIIVEASGKITPKNIKPILKTGVDRVSCGYLTHSITSPDISFEIKVLNND